VPVRFAAVRVSGYRLGCRKSGVMNGTKCRGLVPDQRRRVAVCVVVLARASQRRAR